MSGSFSAEWLALREPADAAARAQPITQIIADELFRRGATRALDLAAGTGSNVHYLSQTLRAPLAWLLADHDPRLLAVASARLDGQIETCVADLSQPSVIGSLVRGRDLVTASALLDLVSAPWLEMVLSACAQTGALVLFALSYDGRIRCTPADDDDDLVCELVNRHQRTDKGFGLALGPDAASHTAEALRVLGYEVHEATSDWRLGPGTEPLQRELIAGWSSAATEMDHTAADRIARWRAQRLAAADAGRSHVIVGHTDLAALPRSK